VVGQIATAITNAEAYEAERRRAEALAEIDRAKTAFFSNASHEFRTPLTLMLSPLEELLLREREQRLVRVPYEEIELIHRNGLRLLKLVNSLLDFSRIEAGRAEALYAPADLAQLTAELASNFRSACERAGLTLTVDCPSLLTPVHVDRDMWEKIVLNLISNAFKFTFDGGISVTLDDDEGAARLIVRDTGVGIPEAEIPHLFERFHRIEGQRSRTYEGSGIGLALVHELVRLHGGTIGVESTAGGGTAFTVRIPFGTVHLAPEHVVARPRTAASAVGADAFVQEALRWLPGEAEAGVSAIGDAAETDAFFAAPAGGRVLLADDNADMRDYIRRLLNGRCEVRTASDGRAALDAIHTQRPDLVLADVMMPVMDGFELLRRIRGDERLRDIPVILLSARAGEESRVEGLAVGANDYLVKPFAARELIARVGANLELARVRTEATAALQELNETLAQRVDAEVAERMKVEEALRQALKMEAIGQLTGGVAHDFNNLLQVVLGNLDTLRRRVSGTVAPTRSDTMRFVESAMRGAERAANLTQRLLAFSRRQPLEPRPVDINRLVTSMSELLRRTLGESIAIETVLGGGVWRIHADPNQLENSIINLAVNARDAYAQWRKTDHRECQCPP
jgi:signal transduction histidine kinase